jgi:hypothetical protein
MQDAYKGTYSTNIANSMNLNNITDDIMDSIDALIASDSDVQGIPNISRLYNRLNTKKSNELGSFSEDIFSIFEDKSMISNLMDIYSKSRSIKQIDEQIDTVCKYMPKLQNALDIKKDSVLVSETFSKDYLNLISGLNRDDKDFSSRILVLKDKYKLEDLLDEMCARTQKYGECFVYHVPYKKAFEKILTKKNGNNGMQQHYNPLQHETAIIKEGVFMGDGLLVDKEAPKLSGNGQFMLRMSSGVLSEVADGYTIIEDSKKKLPKGLYEQFLNEMVVNEAASKDDNGTVKFDKMIPDEVKVDSLDKSASDGFIDAKNGVDRKVNINTKGCVVKILERDHVYPVYIEDICLGYYYIKYMNSNYGDTSSMFRNSVVASGKNNAGNAEMQQNEDKLLKYLAKKICSKIDAQFINSNGDLAKEIYMMLKYDDSFNPSDPNGQLDVTFIPAEDMHHHYYKLDPVTHRGISDLRDGLIPATVWCMITLCNAVGIVTRGQDKRIYYVQQTGVETNVAKTLMNVVNQIKKGNFGVRQLESINNILGIVGKYNDMIIPTGPNGESPVRLETMQGQNIETPTELLSMLEENAIEPIGVPLELINATKGLDYAVHYTISNSKFMTLVQKRQNKEQTMDSGLITKIYNCEFEENTVIKIMLPAPKFITMANSNSVIENTKAYVANIVEIFCSDMGDEEKAEVTSLLMRHFIGSHVDIEAIDNMKSLARVNVAVRSSGEQEEG